ncbi:MAG: hydantoinase/oxoprolinase family protein [Burkholderiaceae bacterium]
MGGTTAKGALVRNGRALKSTVAEVARAYNYQAGSGYPVRVPTIDLIEIGSGGGSIAELDERGLIRVGPRSAGAAPGPACYGQGGTAPTLTDANLVLGYLDPAFFLGGRMKLDAAAAERAVFAGIAQPLGLEPLRAAWGIHEMVNEDVARAFRVHASERGFDYRQACMTAFGGSGPMHAVRIARKLGVPQVILAGGRRRDVRPRPARQSAVVRPIRSYRVELVQLDDAALQKVFDPMIDRVSTSCADAGLPSDRIQVSRKLGHVMSDKAMKWKSPSPKEMAPRLSQPRSSAPTGISMARSRSPNRLRW